MSNFRQWVFAVTTPFVLSTLFVKSMTGRAVAAEVARHNVVYTFSPNKITVVNPKTLESKSIFASDIMWGDVVSSPDHKLLFANDRTNNAVQVISVDSLKVVKSIPVGERPVHTYNPKGRNEIWTHSDNEGTFYVIDIGSLTVKHKVMAASDAAKGGHGKLLWSSDLGDKAYATNTLDSNLHVLSLSQYKETGTINNGLQRYARAQLQRPDKDGVHRLQRRPRAGHRSRYGYRPHNAHWWNSGLAGRARRMDE